MNFSQLNPLVMTQWNEPRWVYCGNDQNLPEENIPQIVLIDRGHGYDVVTGVQWLRGGAQQQFAKWYYQGNARVFHTVIGWLYIPPLEVQTITKESIKLFREGGYMTLAGVLINE